MMSSYSWDFLPSENQAQEHVVCSFGLGDNIRPFLVEGHILFII